MNHKIQPWCTPRKQDQREKFSEIKPLVLTHARQSQVTKNCRKTTSALEPQNIVETRTGREKFSEIEPLVPTHARNLRLQC